MKLLKKFWEKIGEDKFVGRVATVGCTVLTLFTLLFGNVPTAGAWAMGVINGFMIVTEMELEFDEEE
ncbi:MAG: hypothetical protein IJQ82_02255 [Selenomonadaceae bacterium]|nr:hypothetical protein [Selenomonadaceae bacterium]